MIPAPFEYVRAGSVDEAIAALTEHGDEAKVLAGGHSLLPLMKLRLATPSVLVDVGRVGDLKALEGGARPVHGKRADDHVLEDVVRDRLCLQRVAAGAQAAQREDAER